MSATGDTVLVVEDEAAMRRFIRASLTAHGYRVIEVERAGEVVGLVTSHQPALILMDLGLPDGDGLLLTKEIRGWSTVPIVVLSARGREEDKVQALDAGADDYLTKPFGVNELLARIRVALRHAEQGRGGFTDPTATFGDLVVDFSSRVVRRAGVEVHLTPIEYKLLALLARHAGKVLTHQQILREVWGGHQVGRTHYVRVHMAELRKKIEVNPARPKLIVTEPGVGYRLRATDDPAPK